jgi:hypothetical protein
MLSSMAVKIIAFCSVAPISNYITLHYSYRGGLQLRLQYDMKLKRGVV